MNHRRDVKHRRRFKMKSLISTAFVFAAFLGSLAKAAENPKSSDSSAASSPSKAAGPKVIKAPPTTNAKEITKVVLIGDTTRLQCPITGSDMTIEWFTDGERIEEYIWERYYPKKNSLKIVDVMKEDRLFICKGTNGYGNAETRIKLIVVDPNDPNFSGMSESQITSLSAPKFTEETLMHPRYYRKTVGEPFKLSCEAALGDATKVNWYRARNDNGLNSRMKTFSNPDLLGLIKPEKKIARQNKMLAENTVEFEAVPEEMVSRRNPNRAVLNIRGLTEEDSGNYACVAENRISTVSRNFSLDVQSAGYMQETRFLVEPTNKTVRSGEDVTLECKVASMTRPSIIWLKEVQQILGQTQPDMIDLGEKRFKVIKNKTEHVTEGEYFNRLVIENADNSSGGNYHCFVLNLPGYDTRSAYVTVIKTESFGLTGTPSTLMIVLICALSATFILFALAIIYIARRKFAAGNKASKHHHNENPSSARLNASAEGGCSSSAGSNAFNVTNGENGDVRENLMKGHYLQQQQDQYHQQYPPHGMMVAQPQKASPSQDSRMSQPIFGPAPTAPPPTSHYHVSHNLPPQMTSTVSRSQQQPYGPPPPSSTSSSSAALHSNQTSGSQGNQNGGHPPSMAGGPPPSPPPPSLHDDSLGYYSSYPVVSPSGYSPEYNNRVEQSGPSRYQHHQYEVPQIHGSRLQGDGASKKTSGASSNQAPIYPYRSQQFGGSYYD